MAAVPRALIPPLAAREARGEERVAPAVEAAQRAEVQLARRVGAERILPAAVAALPIQPAAAVPAGVAVVAVEVEVVAVVVVEEVVEVVEAPLAAEPRRRTSARRSRIPIAAIAPRI